MIKDLFDIYEPEGPAVPILISIPHSGTQIPENLRDDFEPEVAETLPDTDWILEELYDFAPSLGITVIKANYSRYVIDLNRSPYDKELYPGRFQTSLIPTTTFDGRDIYKEDPDIDSQLEERIDLFYQPYHSKIDQILNNMKKMSPHVLLFDAHSITRDVPLIHKESLPDLMFGTYDGRSCHSEIVDACLEITSAFGSYDVRLNDVFKGGFITRSKGNPDSGINAIQLEMSNDLYYNPETGGLREDTLLPQDLAILFQKIIPLIDELR